MRIKTSWIALSVAVLSVGLLLVVGLEGPLFSGGQQSAVPERSGQLGSVSAQTHSSVIDNRRRHHQPHQRRRLLPHHLSQHRCCQSSPRRHQPRTRQCHRRYQGPCYQQLPQHGLPRPQPCHLRSCQPLRRHRQKAAAPSSSSRRRARRCRRKLRWGPLIAGRFKKHWVAWTSYKGPVEWHLRATDPRSHPPLPTEHWVRRDWLPHGGPSQPLGYASMKRLSHRQHKKAPITCIRVPK